MQSIAKNVFTFITNQLSYYSASIKSALLIFSLTADNYKLLNCLNYKIKPQTIYNYYETRTFD